MKIQSRFKDYYDYVAHAYGGGDPKHVYVREPILDEFQQPIIEYNCELPNKMVNYRYHLDDGFYKHLCICGKYYTVRAEYGSNSLLGPYRLFTEKNFPEIYEKEAKKRSWWNRTIFSEEDYIGKKLPVITEIAEMIWQPVFMINRVSRMQKGFQFFIDRNIPILADYDIPSIIPAEQMYQDLSYYFINTMYDSLREVPVAMTDKEKTLQHGFDIKQSFRHRK